jgi:ubiquinone/menaquinone biosynthesis C-methylase UbiE
MAELLCPAWLSFTLTNVFRRMAQDPDRILRPFIKDGDTAIDVGCGPGYFTIPMARLVGSRGYVVAADIQQKMLDKTRRRAERAGVADRIDLRLSGERGLGLRGVCADFALIFWMAHEVDDLVSLFREILEALKPGGCCLLVEPRVHVTEARYGEIVSAAVVAGFERGETPAVRLSRAVVLRPRATSRNRPAGDTGS